MKTIKQILEKNNENSIYTFSDSFNNIIEYYSSDYNGTNKEKLKSFFEDLQHGGCMSGMISDFVYNSDCKKFYIEHIDDLEDFKNELEDSLGEPIKNRYDLPHYTFIVWLCFEEYAYNLYNNIFEN